MIKKDFYQTKSVHMAVQTAELNLLGYSLDQELSLSCSLMNISRGNCIVKIRPLDLKEVHNTGILDISIDYQIYYLFFLELKTRMVKKFGLHVVVIKNM